MSIMLTNTTQFSVQCSVFSELTYMETLNGNKNWSFTVTHILYKRLTLCNSSESLASRVQTVNKRYS